MDKNFNRIIIFTLLIGVVLAACGSAEETEEIRNPVDVYWEYWNYCVSGKEEKAELLLTNNAKDVGERFGVCSFMHDYSLVIGQFPGYNELLLDFTDIEPEVHIDDDSATLIWAPNEGMVTAVIVLLNVDGEWKIDEFLMMT
jgi:hypothetical protein